MSHHTTSNGTHHHHHNGTLGTSHGASYGASRNGSIDDSASNASAHSGSSGSYGGGAPVGGGAGGEDEVVLQVVLPDGSTDIVTMPYSKQMMDVSVQLCASRKLNPGAHKLLVYQHADGEPVSYKASQTIGSLDVSTVYLINKKAAKVAKHKPDKHQQPFEKTHRLTVNLPRGQKTVLRVSPKTLLGELYTQICTEKGLDQALYEIQHQGVRIAMEQPIAERNTIDVVMTQSGIDKTMEQQRQYEMVNGKSFTLNPSRHPSSHLDHRHSLATTHVVEPVTSSGNHHHHHRHSNTTEDHALHPNSSSTDAGDGTMPKKQSSPDIGYMPEMVDRKKKKGFLKFFSRKKDGLQLKTDPYVHNVAVRASTSMSAISDHHSDQHHAPHTATVPRATTTSHISQQQPHHHHQNTTATQPTTAATQHTTSSVVASLKKTAKRQAPPPPPGSSHQMQSVVVAPAGQVQVHVTSEESSSNHHHLQQPALTAKQQQHSRGSSHSSGFDETSISPHDSPLESPGSSSRDSAVVDGVGGATGGAGTTITPATTGGSSRATAHKQHQGAHHSQHHQPQQQFGGTLTKTQVEGIHAFMSLPRRTKKRQAPKPPGPGPASFGLPPPASSHDIDADVDTTELPPPPQEFITSSHTPHEYHSSIGNPEDLPAPPDELLYDSGGGTTTITTTTHLGGGEGDTTSVGTASNGDSDSALCNDTLSSPASDKPVSSVHPLAPPQFIAPPPPDTPPPPQTPRSSMMTAEAARELMALSAAAAVDDESSSAGSSAPIVHLSDSSTQVHVALTSTSSGCCCADPECCDCVAGGTGDRGSLVSHLSSVESTDDYQQDGSSTSADLEIKNEAEEFADKMRSLTAGSALPDAGNSSSSADTSPPRIAHVSDVTRDQSSTDALGTTESTDTGEDRSSCASDNNVSVMIECDASGEPIVDKDTQIDKHATKTTNHKPKSLKDELDLGSDVELDITQEELDAESTDSESEHTLKSTKQSVNVERKSSSLKRISADVTTVDDDWSRDADAAARNRKASEDTLKSSLSLSEEILLTQEKTEQPKELTADHVDAAALNTNKSNNTSLPSKHSSSDEESADNGEESEEDGVLLLNDYRVAKMRKEEVIDFQFGGKTKQQAKIVKRNSSKNQNEPVIQNLRQMYRKPARTTPTEPIKIEIPAVDTPVTTTADELSTTPNTTTFSNPLEEVLTSKPPKSSNPTTNSKPPKSILRRSSYSSPSEAPDTIPGNYNWSTDQNNRYHHSHSYQHQPQNTRNRILEGGRTKSELSVRDVEKAIAHARLNMNVLLGDGGEPDVSGTVARDDDHVHYNAKSPVQQSVSRISFQPRSEHERQEMLESKSIAMMAAPAHRTPVVTSSAGPSRAIGARAGLYGIQGASQKAIIMNEAAIHPHVLADSDYAKQTLQEQYEQLKKQYARWQHQLKQNQAILSHTAAPTNGGPVPRVAQSALPNNHTNVRLQRAESDANRFTSVKPERVIRHHSLRDDMTNGNGGTPRRSILAERFKSQENKTTVSQLDGNRNQVHLQSLLRGDELLAAKSKLKSTSSTESDGQLSPAQLSPAQHSPTDHSFDKPTQKSTSKLVLGLRPAGGKKLDHKEPSSPPPQASPEPKSILRNSTNNLNRQQRTSNTYDNMHVSSTEPLQSNTSIFGNASQRSLSLRSGPQPYAPPRAYSGVQSVSSTTRTSGHVDKVIPVAPVLPTQAVPPPAPPLAPASAPPPVNRATKVNRQHIGGGGGKPRLETKLDPREELMIAIRSSAARQALRKVPVGETKWH